MNVGNTMSTITATGDICNKTNNDVYKHLVNQYYGSVRKHDGNCVDNIDKNTRYKGIH